MVKTNTQTNHPKQPEMPRQNEGSTAGCGSPKEGKLTEPVIRKGFLEKVVLELRVCKTQPECEQEFQWRNG